MVAVEHPDPPEEAKFNKFNTEQMGVPPRAQPIDAFVDLANGQQECVVHLGARVQIKSLEGDITFNGTVTEGPSLRYEDSTECCWTITFDKGYPSCYERFPRRWTSKTIVEWMLSYAECCGEKISNKHGSRSPYEHEVPFALVQRPQQPRVVLTQTRPSGPQEHKEQSALVQRPQQSCATEAQIGPNNQHKEQSALVQRPQEPRVAETQIGPGSPREREEQQSALAQQQQQPHATEAQPEPRKPEHQSKPEPQKPEPQSVIEPQSRPEPGDPKPRAPQKPGKPKELRVETTDAEPDHWKPGGFEPRAFDPGGSTEKKVRKPAHNSCAPLRVRLRLRGDG